MTISSTDPSHQPCLIALLSLLLLSLLPASSMRVVAAPAEDGVCFPESGSAAVYRCRETRPTCAQLGSRTEWWSSAPKSADPFFRGASR
jgi:hypothetical protein